MPISEWSAEVRAGHHADGSPRMAQLVGELRGWAVYRSEDGAVGLAHGTPMNHSVTWMHGEDAGELAVMLASNGGSAR